LFPKYEEREQTLQYTHARARVCVYFFILSLKLYKLPKSITTRKLLLEFVKIANSCLLTSINYKHCAPIVSRTVVKSRSNLK